MNEITLTSIPNVVKELEKAFYDIPFENSDFQNKNFVIGAQITPERAYRAIGLRMFSKIRALKEALYARQIEDIDIEEMKYKCTKLHINDFEFRRLKVQITQKLDNRNYTDKLINDALHECNVLYVEFKKYPQYTREQFELGEEVHFMEHLTRQVKGCIGATESLTNMSQDYPRIDHVLKALEDFNGTN